MNPFVDGVQRFIRYGVFEVAEIGLPVVIVRPRVPLSQAPSDTFAVRCTGELNGCAGDGYNRRRQRRSQRSCTQVVGTGGGGEKFAQDRQLEVDATLLQLRRLRGVCVVEPRQGNVHAINAAFETARETFHRAVNLLMIDDDEIASPGWLEAMLNAAESSGADIVGGPVWPDFDDAMKRGLRHHPAFAPAYDATGPAPVIYGSGNCLIRSSDAPWCEASWNPRSTPLPG